MEIRVFQAEMNSNRLKAQGSMVSAVACASVPKITVVIGGCHGVDSYAMVSSVVYSLMHMFMYRCIVIRCLVLSSVGGPSTLISCSCGPTPEFQ